MKRMLKAVLISFLLIAITLRVFGAELWNKENCRASDSTGALSELQKESLDEMCIECVSNYEVDLAVLSVTPEEYEDSSLSDLAQKYYEENDFGYGESRDCIIFICDTESQKAEYFEFGNVHGRVPESYYEFAAERTLGYKESNGIFGVLYTGGRFIVRYLENRAESEIRAEVDEVADNANAGMETDNADTEPADVGRGEFVPHHDENAPRVVDRADIFTDEEESSMAARLSKLKDEICCDLVILTDKSTHGRERRDYAADFFDYGGYGWGYDYEGACLFICMDPDDRGWWVANSGAKAVPMYTEEIANLMDDALYEYMKAGEYAKGVNDWITNYATFYTKGYPFAPDWLPAAGAKEPERIRNKNAPRIDDVGGSLSGEQEAELTAMAKEISGKHELDVVIHTTKYDAGMDLHEYAEKFYRYNGYGIGNDYDGIALVALVNNRGYYRKAVIFASGAGKDKLTDVNYDRLLGFYTDKADFSDDNYAGMKLWLDKLDSMLKTGRVPRSGAYWGFIVVFGMLLGAVFGKVTLSRAKKRMETPALSTNADAYLVDGSLSVTGTDRYLSSSTSRSYSPVSTGSSSSGGSSSSSHRSSYSGSYRSSSGRTHSGSGRNF